MATINITVQSLLNTAVYNSYAVDNAGTIGELKASIESVTDCSVDWFDLVFNDSVLATAPTIGSYGIVEGSRLRTHNKIGRLATKELRQKAKLDLAALDRAAAGNPRATYEIAQLPTQYDDNGIIDNSNVGGLVEGRPWTAGPQNDFEFSSNDNRWVINDEFATGSTFSDPAPSNPNYTYPDGSTGKTYNFDGTTYMYSTNLAINTAWQSNSITVDFWFYPTANTVQLLTELSGPALNAAFHATVLEISSTGNIKARFWQGVGNQIITSTNTVDLNQWNHIYFIERANGTHTFELNGVATTGTPTYTRITPLVNLDGVRFAIGGDDVTNMGNTGSFQGKIGNLNVHDYIVASTYSALVSKFRL